MSTDPLRNFAMVVEYDGTDYHGFQFQPECPTVQGELEKAIGRITGEQVRVHGAGRTDAGVHASGQVVSVRLESSMPGEGLVRALNAVLPLDVAVRQPREAPPEFHARYSAKARTYRYSVWNGRIRSPLQARYTCHWTSPLDAAAMAEACEALIGEQDLAAFSGPLAAGQRTGQGGRLATVRRIEGLTWQRRGNLVVMEITANGFLPHMVRNLAGAALRVGSGLMGLDGIADLLQSRDRRRGPPPAPASGLCLVRVRYDPVALGDDSVNPAAEWPDDNGRVRGYNVDSGL